jgi:transposase-like protein/IS1 family transposase
VVTHGFYKTRAGRRRRFRCQACGKTFSSTIGTPYFRLQHSRSKFDQAACMSVEGVSKSAISRIQSIGWNTVHRWLEKASESCLKFNSQKRELLDLRELQADEIRTIASGKNTPIWIFAALDVWSRYWPATVVGKRNSENTQKLFRNVSIQTKPDCVPFVATDGYDLYESAARRCFGKCLYVQVVKTRRRDRIVKVERKQIIGSELQFEKALLESEDSEKLNTSFIERLNLTIRQGTAFLTRRTACFARMQEFLKKQLEILRCHYNFLRPHRSLKFGRVTRTRRVSKVGH